MAVRRVSSSSDKSTDNEHFSGILVPKDCPFLDSFHYNGGRLKWIKNLESLKKFFDDVLGLRGKWSSPGGNSKKFKCNNLDIVVTWYHKKQQTLLFQGKSGYRLKEELINLIGSRVNANEETTVEEVENKDVSSPSILSSNSPFTISTVRSNDQIEPTGESKVDGHPADRFGSLNLCSCPCRELVAEIEGVKLDIAILQNQFERHEASTTKKNLHAELSSLNRELIDAKERCKILEGDISIIVRKRVAEVKELNQVITSLTDNTAKIEEERDSLRLALQIIMEEKNETNVNPNPQNHQTESKERDKQRALTRSERPKRQQEANIYADNFTGHESQSDVQQEENPPCDEKKRIIAKNPIRLTSSSKQQQEFREYREKSRQISKVESIKQPREYSRPAHQKYGNPSTTIYVPNKKFGVLTSDRQSKEHSYNRRVIHPKAKWTNRSNNTAMAKVVHSKDKAKITSTTTIGESFLNGNITRKFPKGKSILDHLRSLPL